MKPHRLQQRLIAPERIAGELVRARKQARETQQANGEESDVPLGMRVTLNNLVILNRVSEHCVGDEQIDQVIEEICFAHPSRIFIINYRLSEDLSSEESSLATAVSSRCVVAANGSHICSEEIYIDAAADAVGLVSNLVTSLLVPDVQSTLVLMSDPRSFSDRPVYYELCDALSQISDLVVYDSMLFKVFDSSYDRVRELSSIEAASGFSGRIIRDLNWGRIARWKALIAEQFDASSFSDGAIRLKSISCETLCNKFGSFSAESLLLMGWCAAKLGLTQEESAPQEITTKKERKLSVQFKEKSSCNDRSVSFEIKSVGEAENSCSADFIQRVSFLLENAAGTFQINIERDTANDLCSLSTNMQAETSGNKDSCDLSVRLVPFKTPELSSLLAARAADQAVDTSHFKAEENARFLSSLMSES